MIYILRLSHRKDRDKRVTTHCGLVARAFGADGIFISGERDEAVLKSINSLSLRWGGSFFAEHAENWKALVSEMRKKGFKIVHMTMYGEDFRKKKKALGGRKLLIIVGSEKVPREVYDMADYNIAVGNQPHSEVGALAVFLYEQLGMRKRFGNAKLKIVPQKRGKKVIES